MFTFDIEKEVEKAGATHANPANPANHETELARLATLAVAESRNAANDAPDTLPDPAAEARRQRVLAMLAERPGVRYAAITDALAVPGSVLLTLAVRHVGTVEQLIPAEKWDGVLFLDLIERHSGTVH